MEVKDIHITMSDGYPALAMTVDDKKVLFTPDSKRTILDGFNAVYLGPEFEDDYQVTMPADDYLGRPAHVLKGFTDEPGLTEIIRLWLNDTNRRGK